MPVSGYHGLLIVDKPLGLTSRAVVDRAQAWFPHGTRIGHTGTLDPLATGVMVLCTGIATRLTEYVQRMEKVYCAGIRLGVRSDTDDAEGAIHPVPVTEPPTREQIEQALHRLVGVIEQVPPAFSAAKIAGRRAYDLARQGREVNPKPRPVEIHEIVVNEYAYPTLNITVRCSKGTYIRALARDIGAMSNTGAMLSSLRRIRVGHFSVEGAAPLDSPSETARGYVLSTVEAVRELPQQVLPDPLIVRLQQGQAISREMVDAAIQAGEVAVMNQAGDLVAIGKIEANSDVLVPHKVFLQGT